MSEKSLVVLIFGKLGDVPDYMADENMVVLTGLKGLVESYFKFSIDFRGEPKSPLASYFMPVSLRSLMETASIALLARVDPLRVIHSSKAQESGAYSNSKQQPSALKWKDDVIGDIAALPKPNTVPATEKAGDGSSSEGNKASKPVWDPTISPSKIPRYLLSEQNWSAFWLPCVKNATNWLNENKRHNSLWLNEFLTYEVESLHYQLVIGGNRVYSELSKGIHPEFAVRRQAEFDSASLLNHFELVAKWVCLLAFLSHFSTSFGVGLVADDAFSAVVEVEKLVNG